MAKNICKKELPLNHDEGVRDLRFPPSAKRWHPYLELGDGLMGFMGLVGNLQLKERARVHNIFSVSALHRYYNRLDNIKIRYETDTDTFGVGAAGDGWRTD